MSKVEQGNKYELTKTIHGEFTFKHLETSEILHGQVGPKLEAEQLYVEQSGINQTSLSHYVVYDLGMGCGAQLFAMYEAFLGNKNIKKLTIVSFDLEKEGLQILKENIEYFSHLKKNLALLNLLLNTDHLHYSVSTIKEFEWIFLKGDFSNLSDDDYNFFPNADVMCYDFFSPAKHPHLWIYSNFKKLYRKANVDSKLITYSSATSVRAALLAAGFFVGYGPVSGKKAKSTVAAKKLDNLIEPLPIGWKNTFTASSAKFSKLETEENLIIQNINSHPQW
ncbi:MnmC family methyltransferase [Pigmentibacter sp. JX0631]|uniref:MnmC family methyltransferase n=1 Tax=Pigmentibacter sp. JX0631 TaxID=2976982 RepID=UPI0024694060|nr:MnmC family methyltransferase [Pigmentibacter sp. JX0631]WGL60159.1 MnmC family methyltransferase [Pigmentibacter sp. JX0631]